MRPRSNDIGPYLRGISHPPEGDVAYPRVRPVDIARLAEETRAAAAVPAGVRLEMVGTAKAIDVRYRTASATGASFAVWRNGIQIDEQQAVSGSGVARLSLGKGDPDNRAVIYLPEAARPVIDSITPVNGLLEPAPPQPRWLAVGDAVTQGRLASAPARSWAAIVGRKTGVDLVNFGFDGPPVGDIPMAEILAGQSAAAITVSYGASLWRSELLTPGMAGETVEAFLQLVRRGHPATPLVVVSPLVLPDGEDRANRLGATMAEVREAVEAAVSRRVEGGDRLLTLVGGRDILRPEHLVDGVHPGNEGHTRIAARLANVLIGVLPART